MEKLKKPILYLVFVFTMSALTVNIGFIHEHLSSHHNSLPVACSHHSGHLGHSHTFSAENDYFTIDFIPKQAVFTGTVETLPEVSDDLLKTEAASVWQPPRFS